MYPDFSYLIKGLLGINPPEWLSLFKTFGLMMALSFLAAAAATGAELKRKERLGLLKPFLRRVKKDKSELASPDDNPWKEELTYPHHIITEIVFAAAFGGILGAKIFSAFETWSDFIKDPIGNFFSPSGLTFYGGLIVATLVIYYYTRKFKIDFRHLADAAAPAIMLAYGIGRLGCQLSGDGDWGIYNTAYASQPNAAIVSVAPADTGKYHYMLMHYNSETAKHEQADHIYYPAAAGLPQWLVAMNYPHNVAYEGMQIEGDTGEFNRVLPICVFPTPIYEFFAAMLLFGVMWGLRKRLNKPLAMIALYMIFAGIERFLVELIRVNTKIDLGFIKPTQAELISVFLVLGGTLILLLPQKKENAPEVLQ